MIAFLREDKITQENKIYVMNPDGSNVRLLGDGGIAGNGDADYNIYDLAWSPDGRMIAYSTSAGIKTMNLDGFEVKKVVALENPRGPTWSPDGSSLAFYYGFSSYFVAELSASFLTYRIFIASLNGSGITSTNLVVDTLTWWPMYDTLPRNGFDWHPDWSGDGKKIVFCSDRASIWDTQGVYDIYTMNPDGSEVTRLTDSNVHKSSPKWSPDGEKIAFNGGGDANISCSIYVMNADGSDLFQVTHNLSQNSHNPTWSPDGTRLAFVSDHDGNSEIYVINIDGTGLKRLTNDPRADKFPAWSRGKLGAD